jgi:hypothetical protein
MKSPQLNPNRNTHYELRFHSLADEGTGYAFPCDAGGRVNMDTLTDRARNNYLYARAVVGYQFSTPAVLPAIAA